MKRANNSRRLITDQREIFDSFNEITGNNKNDIVIYGFANGRRRVLRVFCGSPEEISSDGLSTTALELRCYRD